MPIAPRLLLGLVMLAWTSSACSGDDDGGGDDDDDATQPYVCDTEARDRGDRILGMDILNRTAEGTFDENLTTAQGMGVSFLDLHMTWSSLEATPNVLVDPDDTLALFRQVLDANDGLRISLTLRPIDLTGKTVPSDLEDTRFNDPAMVARFEALLDFVLTIVPPSRLTSIQIGNEIDGYDTSDEHPDFWSDYGELLFQVNQYVDATYPGLRIGFTATHAGITEGPLRELGIFTALASAVDVVGVTYYPLRADFTVEAPSVVERDFAALVRELSGHAIYLQEVGYHTADSTEESEAAQAEFYCNVFRAWDAHPEIESLIIVRLNDVSEEAALELAGPYGIGDESFIEYLRTLGLRTYEGAEKTAASVVREQAQARGF